jgi:hypothetical protein
MFSSVSASGVRKHSFSIVLAAIVAGMAACSTDEGPAATVSPSELNPLFAKGGTALSPQVLAEGQRIFRFDTFGDETYWTDTLHMPDTISKVVSPLAALGLGLKVDIDALPASLQAALAAGDVDLNSPATTTVLLSHDAVVGLKGTVSGTTLTRVGITCALCHSTVDNSFAPGIGHRLDGWPNRDLNVGEIVALSPSPVISTALRAILKSWGPGRYDPRINFDGINTPLVMPGAYGLRQVALETFTGDGPVSYWNAYVAITQMHGHGTFVDPRIGVSVSNPPELVGPKLDALRAYQFSLSAPAGVVTDRSAVQRGKDVFMGAGGCATCHYGVAFTDVNDGILHSPASVGQDPTYANRTATKMYRTTPLRGLWHPPQLQGPYFHDGSAPTLEAVVAHYVTTFGLTLSSQQRADLVTYLKTL